MSMERPDKQNEAKMGLHKFRNVHFQAIDRVGEELNKELEAQGQRAKYFGNESLGATAYLHRKRERAGGGFEHLADEEVREAYQNWAADQADYNRVGRDEYMRRGRTGTEA